MNEEIFQANIHRIDVMQIEKYKNYINSYKKKEVPDDDGRIPEMDTQIYKDVMGILSGKRHTG